MKARDRDRERVVSLSLRYHSLREQMAALKVEMSQVQAELDRALGGEGGAADEPEQVLPLVDRIVRVLDAQPVKAYSVNELLEALNEGEDVAPTIRSTLVRLAAGNKIRRTGRGEYSSLKWLEPPTVRRTPQSNISDGDVVDIDGEEHVMIENEFGDLIAEPTGRKVG